MLYRLYRHGHLPRTAPSEFAADTTAAACTSAPLPVPRTPPCCRHPQPPRLGLGRLPYNTTRMCTGGALCPWRQPFHTVASYHPSAASQHHNSRRKDGPAATHRGGFNW